MAFPTPTVVISKNSAGSVTTTSGTFNQAVASGTPVVIGISVSSDTPTITSVGPDSKGNIYTLVGHQTTTTGQPIWIYRSWITTSLANTDTLAVTISAGAVINFIGVAGPGSVFVPLQFTGSFSTVAAASFAPTIPALPNTVNGFVIAFSVNASAAPTWLTPGPTALTTLSGGGGPFFSCAYENVLDFPAPIEIDMAPNSTATIAATAFISEYTDLYDTSYSQFYGQFSGISWPALGPLPIEVDLLINGTWTDITDFVYQRDGSVTIRITSGRPDESQKIVPSQCQMQLNNRGGTFSPKNSTSQFFPFITKNTQIRVLIPISHNNTDAGQWWAFSGEVSSWPPAWDPTGNDIWVDVVASGITRRMNQQAAIGSALKRFYSRKSPSDPTYPVAYWPCEDQSNSSTLMEVTGNGSPAVLYNFAHGTFPTLASDNSFGGSDALPVMNQGIIGALTNSPNDTGTVTYNQPGTHQFMPRQGLTVLNTVEVWGGSGGGTNGYQANTGKGASGGGGEYSKDTAVAIALNPSYPVVVGAGGAGGALSSNGTKANPGKDGTLSSFAGDSVTTIGHPGTGGLFVSARAGKGGSGSTAATHFNGGAGAKNSGAFFGGSGGGSSAGTAAPGNAGTAGGGSNTGAAGGAAPTGGGAGGKGGNGGVHVDQGGTAGSLPGGGGGSGGENASNGAAHSGGNGGAGRVKLTWTPLAAPTFNSTRFLLHIPTGGDTNNGIVARVWSAGKVNRMDLTYTTAAGGTLTMTGFGPGLLFTSVGITGVNGINYLVSMELYPAATINYRLTLMPANNPSAGVVGTTSTASASGAIGVVTEVDLNPLGDMTGTSAGHIVVQYTFESLSALSGAGNAGLGPVSGWIQEKIGHRFGRLCTEQGIPYQLIGDVEHGVSVGAQMGPQPDDKLINVLQQIEDLDGGFLYEDPSIFGISYRTYSTLVNQQPKLLADYSLGHVSPPFQPVEDEQLIRNDVTVSRTNGSSVTLQQTTGPLSNQDPPNGVGDYSYSITVNAFSDTQLSGVATRILRIGTTDEARYPQVTFQLSRAAVKDIFSSLTTLVTGSRIKILNPPSFLLSSTIDLLVLGFNITLNSKKFDITLNCVPASPYI